MADQDPITRGNGSGDPDSEPQVATIAQYIKDLSVESPSSPQAFQWQAQPQLEVQFNINVEKIADDVHEVVLKIEVSARSDQGVHFLIDLSYAGLYGLRNIPEEALPPFLLIEAPRLLFPFARQIIADASQNTGFPPLLLDPIDFAAAYMAQLAGGRRRGRAASRGGRRRRRPKPADRRRPAKPRKADDQPMNLLKAGGTIGGLTMVSRILGFAREMVFARVMGATAAAEVFIWAFQLPNLLRRLLGEGAFSQGFVPLFARRIGKDGDLEDAQALRRRGAGGVPAGPDRDHRIVHRRHAGGGHRGRQRALDRRSRQVRLHRLPDPDHLPLSDLHQHGVAVQRDPQFAVALRRRGLRSGAAQRRAARRAAAGAGGRDRDRGGHGLGGAGRRRAAAGACASSRRTAPASGSGFVRRG